MYRFYNPNPLDLMVGDCVIRALSKALNKGWVNIYSDLCVEGLSMADMPSSNRVWGNYLMDKGFHRAELPDLITVRKFTQKYPKGTYLLGTGSHVVTVIDGDYYDAFDSGDMVPYYYWRNDVL
jgi:hypothetical protein